MLSASCRREPEGLWEATPSLRRLLSMARKHHGSPPPAPRPRGNSAPQYCLCLFAFRPLRYSPGLEEALQRHEQLPRHRHHPNAPPTLAAAPNARAKPTTQGTPRLITPPTPGQLRGHPAHMPIPRLGDPLFPRTLAAVIRRWRSTRSAPHLTPILEVTPAKKLPHQPPRAIDPDASERHPLPHLLDASVLRAGSKARRSASNSAIC